MTSEFLDRIFDCWRPGKGKNILLPASVSTFVVIGPAKSLKIGQQIILWSKSSFESTREIIHDTCMMFISCLYNVVYLVSD